jgi:hypothetical protein
LHGVVPNSDNFSHPCDRRRYIPFFHIKDIDYEHAVFEKYYSVLYVSLNADLTLWRKYKDYHKPKKTKIIFDLADNYLSENIVKSILKSLIFFVTRKNKNFSISFKEAVIRFLEVCDVVTVGSLEQKNDLAYYHPNVYVVRDYFYDDLADLFLKKQVEKIPIQNEINILWEGFLHGQTKIEKQFKEILFSITDSLKLNINFHVVTDEHKCFLFGKYFCSPTLKVLQKKLSHRNINIYFYPWSPNNLISASKKCDFAIIPTLNESFFQSKPENKLILLWMLGLPVLTGYTPSYSRVLKDSDNYSCLCQSCDQWADMAKLMLEKEFRDKCNSNANIYIDTYASKQLIIDTWSKIFEN